jgi:hypothetical protein
MAQKKRSLNQSVAVIAVLTVLLILAGALLIRKEFMPNVLGTENVTPPQAPIETWLWDSPTHISASDLNVLISNAKANHVTTIYITIDEYIDIYELPDPAVKQTRMAQFNESLKNFIQVAQSNGISVQGLAGAPTWANSTYSYIPPIFITYVNEFNTANQGVAHLDGMQFDIEFYNQSGFDRNKQAKTKEYLDLVSRLVQQTKSAQTNIKLGFATPFWLDSNIPSFKYNGKKKTADKHLYDILNNYSYSYVAIMDYRNYADGIDGSINNIKDEMDYAKNTATNVSILVGQETGNEQPAKITFYGLGKDKMYTEMNKVYDYYRTNPNFKGFAINNLNTFISL